jgi:hypothetical protein
MSEFCEHIERDLGWQQISYEESKKLHEAVCGECAAEAKAEKLIARIVYNTRTARRFLI